MAALFGDHNNLLLQARHSLAYISFFNEVVDFIHYILGQPSLRRSIHAVFYLSRQCRFRFASFLAQPVMLAVGTIYLPLV